MKLLRIFAAALALLLLTGCVKDGAGTDETPAPSNGPTELPSEEPLAEATFRRAVLYYLSDEGYIVPVTKLIPWEEGIARACLSYMTGSPENDSFARSMGLKTVIPEGARLTLAIKDGVALLDVSGAVFADGAEELHMLEAAVNTLVEFPTVKAVTVTVDGSGGITDHGVQLPVKSGAYPLNPEDGELATSAGACAATLYFPNDSGSLAVPVTRYMSGEPSVCNLAAALISGTSLKGLRSCFPDNTLLLGAAIENGVLTVDLSDDFKKVSDVEGLYELAKETLMLTIGERFDLESVRILVNGKEFGG